MAVLAKSVGAAETTASTELAITVFFWAAVAAAAMAAVLATVSVVMVT